MIDPHTQRLVQNTASLGVSDVFVPENQHKLPCGMVEPQRLQVEWEDPEAETLVLIEALGNQTSLLSLNVLFQQQERLLNQIMQNQ